MPKTVTITQCRQGADYILENYPAIAKHFASITLKCKASLGGFSKQVLPYVAYADLQGAQLERAHKRLTEVVSKLCKQCIAEGRGHDTLNDTIQRMADGDASEVERHYVTYTLELSRITEECARRARWSGSLKRIPLEHRYALARLR